MSKFLLLSALGLMLISASGNFSIPRKFRGQYRCEMPAYEIEHDGATTKVESSLATLLVYQSKVILRVSGKSFSSFVEKKSSSKRTYTYEVKFDAPLTICRIVFSKKPKSARIELPLFENMVFEKVK